VRCRIDGADRLIERAGDNAIVDHEHRADRDLPRREAEPRLFERRPHVIVGGHTSV
jgi:hypothetical protein